MLATSQNPLNTQSGNVPQGTGGFTGDRQRRPTGQQRMPTPIPQPKVELYHGQEEPPQSHRSR